MSRLALLNLGDCLKVKNKERRKVIKKLKSLILDMIAAVKSFLMLAVAIEIITIIALLVEIIVGAIKIISLGYLPRKSLGEISKSVDSLLPGWLLEEFDSWRRPQKEAK